MNVVVPPAGVCCGIQSRPREATAACRLQVRLQERHAFLFEDKTWGARGQGPDANRCV